MKKISIIMTSIVAVALSIAICFSVYRNCQNKNLLENDYIISRVLAWEDTFDYIDKTVWDYETGYIRNRELQEYTTDISNVFCENSILHLKALKDESGNWTSGSIVSRKGFSFQYGLIEAKIKYDPQQGCWPAVWSKGNCNWKDYKTSENFGLTVPECGEIDLIEYRNNLFTMGCFWLADDTGTQGAVSFQDKDISTDSNWHIIGLERTRDEIRYYYDRLLVGKVAYQDFQEELYEPYYLLIDLAIGGGSMGNPEETLIETEFLVDWIRYYLPSEASRVGKIKKIDIDAGAEFELKAGEQRVLKVNYNTDFVSNYNISWSSSDQSVATCYGGTVKALKNGTTLITATAPNGVACSSVLTVKDETNNLTENILLTADSEILDYKNSTVIRAVAKPNYRSNKKLIWSSSDETVATVDDGIVTAVNENGGTVIITCKAEDGGAESEISISCKGRAVDEIESNGLVVKYTKLGWSEDGWKSDLSDGRYIEATGDASTGFDFRSGLGFKQNFINDDSKYSESATHIISTDTLDANGPFTLCFRLLFKEGKIIDTSGNICEMVNENGGAYCLKFGPDRLNVYGLDGEDYIITAKYSTDDDNDVERAKDFILTKDIDGTYRVYIDDQLMCEDTTLCGKTIPNRETKLVIGNKIVSTAHYQAILAYNRCLSADEIKMLNDELEIMYE